MYIPIGFIILFLFAPNLAILCGIVALAFMYPQVSIPITVVLFILYCFSLLVSSSAGTSHNETNKETKRQTENEIPSSIKKYFFWNIDPKTAKWYQVFLLVPYWILLLIILGMFLVPLAQI